MKFFDPDKPIFKGNLHTHSTKSDGRLSPEEVVALYKAHGYDFLALTDHWCVGEERSYKGMLVLPGIEMDAMLEREAVHIVGVGVTPSLPERVQHPDIPQRYVDAIREDGGLAILCHPLWSLNTLQTVASLRGIAATEVYNSFSGVPWNSARSDASAFLDVAASAGWMTPLVASDDSHKYTGEACLSYTCVQADDLTTSALLSGIRKGALYASQGPAFTQITYENDVIEVECSPVASIVFYSNLVWVRDRCRTGERMTHARYEVNREKGERYVRCELIDAFGRKAWSSPISLY